VSDWLRDLRNRWEKAVQEIKEQLRGPGPNMILDREPLFVGFDRTRPSAHVSLDPGAQRCLAPAGHPKSAREFSEIFVLLAEADDREGHVEVRIGDHRVGVLTTADSAEFRTILAAGKSEGKLLAGEAIRDRDPAGAWALHVYRPEPP
jgi:hypothetical protein